MRRVTSWPSRKLADRVGLKQVSSFSQLDWQTGVTALAEGKIKFARLANGGLAEKGGRAEGGAP